ncbi:MAG TPA: chemotaxis-specific protein-glutamate methyltransferase CheB [Blastocatellia bacterium]
MAKTRVLIVEDSLTIRKVFAEVLSADPDIEIVGEATDGKQAIEMCQRLKPDCMTLDLVLPVMTGLAVTEYVMAFCPTPILIVSAATNRGEAFRTYDALAAGAVDVLDKPVDGLFHEGWDRRFVSAVKIAARVKVITHIRGRMGSARQGAPSSPAQAGRPRPNNGGGQADGCNTDPRIIAVGCSTGGPAAIVEILKSLPKGFPIPILLVIHISPPFGIAFSEWLDGLSRLPVRYARDGEPVPSLGESLVLMAPPEQHLIVESGRLRLTESPARNSCRPSVDVLFESLAVELGGAAIGCLLTGMGRDGAQGLLAMRNAGALTLVQDEASSVVFGMPREAIELGAATRVLSLADFYPALTALACRTP